MVHEMAQRLHERLIGHPEVLVAAAGQHRRPLVVRSPGQLGGQAGLPDAGLPGQEGDPPFTGRRLLSELAQPVELAVPPDEDLSDVGEEGRQRHRGNGKTLLTFHQGIFESVTARDGHEKGWRGFFDHLSGYLPQA